ncbi:hypothetical protein J6590_082399 [Homalodisca vitripennis]|nr:hypothetical protein J6590_082399 [Homalodisca vitripennis]
MAMLPLFVSIIATDNLQYTIAKLSKCRLALFVNWTRCVDIVCLVRPVHQLIEMTTAIRSDPARWKERGISRVLKPELEGADVE